MKAISHTEAETGSLARVAIAATPLAESLAGLVITNPIQRSEPAGAEERVLAMLAPSVPWSSRRSELGQFALGCPESTGALRTEGVAGVASRPRNLRRCFPPKMRSA